jgi:hypothetical protein
MVYLECVWRPLFFKKAFFFSVVDMGLQVIVWNWALSILDSVVGFLGCVLGLSLQVTVWHWALSILDSAVGFLGCVLGLMLYFATVVSGVVLHRAEWGQCGAVPWIVSLCVCVYVHVHVHTNTPLFQVGFSETAQLLGTRIFYHLFLCTAYTQNACTNTSDCKINE